LKKLKDREATSIHANTQLESEIVAQEPDAMQWSTIATNIACRGTDILLGATPIHGQTGVLTEGLMRPLQARRRRDHGEKSFGHRD